MSIRGCVRPSVGPSVGPSHTSWISEKRAEFEQNSIRNKKVCHLENESKTSTRAVSQNASVVRTLFDLFISIMIDKDRRILRQSGIQKRASNTEKKRNKLKAQNESSTEARKRNPRKKKNCWAESARTEGRTDGKDGQEEVKSWLFLIKNSSDKSFHFLFSGALFCEA